MKQYEPLDRDEARSQVAEGVHTALRKALDSPAAIRAHRAISALPPGEWGEACEWWLEALEFQGIELCRVKG